ncbi:MAG: hypothetical protein ACI9DC_004928 [Gammaproteobacteria bacterium]|jgi:uncharacterized protein with von Willebrand factor type A (vWA) domain
MSIEPVAGRLLENLMHFARALRAAGLPVGPGKVLDAVNAVQTVGITDRDDFYWTLHAVFVNRRKDRELFDQAFHVFWRNPRLLERMMSLVLPQFRDPGAVAEESLSRRISDALSDAQNPPPPPERDQPPELEIDAQLTWSDRELLQEKDFEQMSTEEIERAKRAIERMRLNLNKVATRRYHPHAHGPKIDMRRTFRQSLRCGPQGFVLARAKRRSLPPPLVILCDISGSMSRYSRMLLHFMHTLTSDRDRVHSFVFGTRLTNISRYLKNSDVDAALEHIAVGVDDWSGGTRMGTSLRDFNRYWSRRVLGQGAVVLLITDGLDRDLAEGVEREAERLHKSCRRLIWLNPLLRYDRFEPKAAGMRALLPHVDEFRSVHNLDSLEQLCAVLSGPMGSAKMPNAA